MVYTGDLKSPGLRPCGFESRPEHKNVKKIKTAFDF